MSWSSSALFYDALRGVLTAGMPMPKSLELAGQVGGEPHQSLSRRWAAGCSRGTSLAEQLRASAQPPLVVSLITAGEKSGRLVDICAEISAYYRHAVSLRQLVMARLAYPLLLLHIALILVALPTVLFSGGSALWFLAGPCLLWLVVAAAFLAFRHSSPDTLARLALAPGLRWVVMPLLAGNTCLVVRAGLNAGMDIPTSLDLAGDACGNRDLAQRLHEASRQVFAGRLANLTAAFQACALPTEVIEVTRSGELSGRLEETLQQCTLAQLERFRLRTQWAARVGTGVIYALSALAAVLVILHLWASVYGAMASAAQGI